MRNIKKILEKVYNNDSLRKSVVPLFIGNPGLGKTAIIAQFAKEKGVKLVELITSQMSPFEISGIAMPDKDLKKMIYYNFDKIEDLQDNDILFFDELLNGNPVVLNACLTILEQRMMISGKPLPNVMIVAAANEQGMTPLTPQIKERFVWYSVLFDKNMWINNYMIPQFNITSNIGDKLAALIKTEYFTGRNFMTPRSISKSVNMLINDVPVPDEYQKNILPILSELITNTLGDITLNNGEILKQGEMIKWIDLIKHLKNK